MGIYGLTYSLYHPGGAPCGGGGLLRAQRRPRQCCVSQGNFYVAFSKEIWCMPLQMPHYGYDKQVWK